jgi:hypothetical protein
MRMRALYGIAVRIGLMPLHLQGPTGTVAAVSLAETCRPSAKPAATSLG